MKIAVVGCGALGSYYGAKLCRVEKDVYFLLRSDFEVVRRDGVQVHSVDGDFHVRPCCARRPDEIGICDVVFVALKATANAHFSDLITALTGPSTCIVTLQNGLGNEEALAQVFGQERIFGGLCFVCANRLSPGVISHTAYGRIVLGELDLPAGVRCHKIAELLKNAGVPCEVTDRLDHAHWEKLIWNIPFNGLGVAAVAGYDALITGQVQIGQSPGHCYATDQLLSDPKWEQLVLELMMEVIHAAAALGYPIPVEVAHKNVERTRNMGAYKASTLIDFERGKPLELESLFLKPLWAAQKAGVQTPRLTALCSVLSTLDSMQKT